MEQENKLKKQKEFKSVVLEAPVLLDKLVRKNIKWLFPAVLSVALAYEGLIATHPNWISDVQALLGK